MTVTFENSVTLRDAVQDDSDWLVARHRVLYQDEYGFDENFAPLVRDVLTAYFEARVPSRERAWVPMYKGEKLGSIFCVQGAAPDEAKLRLFWLEPKARGQGLANLMLEACLNFAREAGYSEIAVRTYDAHKAAGRLYSKAGFRNSEARATRRFGQALVEQTWRRAV